MLPHASNQLSNRHCSCHLCLTGCEAVSHSLTGPQGVGSWECGLPARKLFRFTLGCYTVMTSSSRTRHFSFALCNVGHLCSINITYKVGLYVQKFVADENKTRQLPRLASYWLRPCRITVTVHHTCGPVLSVLLRCCIHF